MQCEQRVPNAAKGACTRRTVEDLQTFLLNFDHAQVTFGQVGVTKHGHVTREAQDGVLMRAQAAQQVAHRVLSGSAPLTCGSRTWKKNLVAFGQQGQKAGAELGELLGGPRRHPLLPCGFRGLFHQPHQRPPTTAPTLRPGTSGRAGSASRTEHACSHPGKRLARYRRPGYQ